ncbi:MAG: hypothetical protein AABY22_11805 [Nanoarchaeota archaeon]
MKKFKIMDKNRVGVMFFTLVFALFIKLLLDNVTSKFSIGIPQWILFAVSPLLAILIAQKFNEGKLDYKEAGVFIVAIVGINLLVQFIVPSIRELNVLSVSMTTYTGIVATFYTYFITIPMSALISDLITDK